MAFRQAQSDDLRPLAELWNRAFPGERSVAERMRALEAGEPYGGLENAWVEEEDGRLLGAFKAYRMTERLAGAPLPMLGVAAVAVAASARRRGLGRELCRRALRIGRERGDVVSVLYPFRPDYYAALGWGLAGELHSFVFRPDALDDCPERAAVRSADLETGDLRAIAECYERVIATANGPVERGEAAWRHHTGRAGVHAFVYDRDGVRGYLLARYAAAGAPHERTLHIHELIAESDDAYRGLLGWIACQADAWPRVRYDARPDEAFGDRLRDPRPPGVASERELWYPAHRVLRGPMLRILDVPAALRARPRWGGPPGVALTLEIEVDDPELPENRGPWHVSIRESGGRVHESEAPGADARLSTDAATFARIYAGEISPSTAARLGRAEVDGEATALDRTFHTPQSFWLLDAF